MGFYLMRCLHHPGKDEARNGARAEHKAWTQSGGNGFVCVLIGSALHDAGGAPVGNFGILEADGRQDAQAFAEGDPFHRAGIVASIEITPLPDGFQAERVSSPMSPRLSGNG